MKNWNRIGPKWEPWGTKDKSSATRKALILAEAPERGHY